MFDFARVGACQNAKNGRIVARGVAAPERFSDWRLLPFGKLGALGSFFPSLFEVESYTGALSRCWLGGRGWDISKGFRYCDLPGCPA